MWRIIGKAAVAATVLICATGPVFLRPKTRPHYLSGVPIANYKIGGSSTKVRAFSKQALPPVQSNAANEKIQGRLFQWTTGPLTIEHCSISEFAVFVENTGRWTVSLRAKQNYEMRAGGDTEPPFVPGTGQYNDYLLRNLFHVSVRIYGFFDVETTQSAETTGKPALINLQLAPFWVERATARTIVQTGWDPRLARFFEMLNRAEIEFFYR